MNKIRKCLRCSHQWSERIPLQKYCRGEIHVPKRCAGCRSPLWNKIYVRKMSQDRLNPGSIAYTPPLPFLLSKKELAGGSRLRIAKTVNQIISQPKKTRIGRGSKKRANVDRGRTGVRTKKRVAVKTTKGKK